MSLSYEKHFSVHAITTCICCSNTVADISAGCHALGVDLNESPAVHEIPCAYVIKVQD